jgi:type IV secretion system protein VirB9
VRRLAFALLAALVAAPASAQVQPQAAAGDPRDQVVAYDPNQIVQLQGAPGYQLTVEFAPDELIENVAVGDASAWQVTPNRRGDHLFVKPIQYGVSTNMTVITTVRVYLFELVSGGGSAAFRVRFSYPGELTETAAAEETPQEEGRYRLSGTRSLRPSRISDDGIHTYVEWPQDRDIPAVYAIDARGRESLVNGAMREGIFVIDSVARQLVFRIDDHVARATRVRQRARN